MSFPITANTGTLASVLRLGVFKTPWHQRPYAWKPEHVQSLLDDLMDNVNSNQPYHFLGTITLIPLLEKKQKWDINDGQQRIITFLLICANLCKYFNESGYTSGENQTIRMLFDISKGHSKTLADADKLNPRVILSTNDKADFETIICGHSVKKNSAMTLAYNTINDFFLDPKCQSPQIRKNVLGFLLNKLIIAWIEIKGDINSIAAFETQNTRGKSLEQVQITCAYFYSCLRDDDVRSKRLNEQIESIRTSMGKNENTFFDYARCSTQCRYGHLSNDRFCRDIKKAISILPSKEHGDEVCDLVNDLSKNHKIQVFQTLTHIRAGEEVLRQLTKDARQNNAHRKIFDYLKDLQKYSSVSNAIMFSLLCKYVDSSNRKQSIEVAKLVYKSSKLLSSFFQRAAHSFTGSFSPSPYEHGVAELARDIARGKCKTAEHFLSTLRELDRRQNIIPDSHYKERMKSIAFPAKIPVAKYILARINEYLDKELAVVESKSTVEHILPKGKTHIDAWDFTDDEHGRYMHRLGNLTLLSPRDNKPQEKHNSSFAAKKEIYQKSAYLITEKLCECKKWDKNTIEHRQAELAKYSAIIWNFKID